MRLPNGIPFLFYIGWLCAICAPTYCICSGYAHFKQGEAGGLSFERNLKRFLKFCVHYWIVVLLVTVAGILMHSATIPGNLWRFITNFLLLSWSYNGIWWYAFVYAVYVFAAPFLYKIVNKINYKFLIPIVLVQFIVVETLQKVLSSRIDGIVLTWLWNHVYYLLGARLLGYIAGMIVAKEQLIGRIKAQLQKVSDIKNNVLILLVLLICSLVLCVLNKGILLVLYAVLVFVCFNLIRKRGIVKNIFLWLGKQSTFIWLVHPFIYTSIFPEVQKFLLRLNYGSLIYAGLLLITGMIGVVLNYITKRIIDHTVSRL